MYFNMFFNILKCSCTQGSNIRWVDAETTLSRQKNHGASVAMCPCAVAVQRSSVKRCSCVAVGFWADDWNFWITSPKFPLIIIFAAICTGSIMFVPRFIYASILFFDDTPVKLPLYLHTLYTAVLLVRCWFHLSSMSVLEWAGQFGNICQLQAIYARKLSL